jgi:hypothetical protein
VTWHHCKVCGKWIDFPCEECNNPKGFPVKLEIFKPEMFDDLYMGFNVVTLTKIANMSNKILNDYLEANAVKVSGIRNHDVWVFDEMICKQAKPHDTHQALLICIEPIEKKCEVHEPKESGFHSCKHCGVKLAQKWEPVE